MAWLYQAQTNTKAIQLGNEEYGHTLSIGTNWTKIRIGCRVAVNAIQAFIGQGPAPFALGMCRGTSAMFKSQSCAEFLGLILGNAASQTFSYATSPGPHVFNGVPAYVSKVNGAITTHTGLSSNEYFSALSSVRSVVFVDILKTSGTSATSFSVTGFMPGNATQATTDNTFQVFMQSMESNATPTNTNLITTTAVTHTGLGLLDTMYVGWSKSYPTLTLFELCAMRVI